MCNFGIIARRNVLKAAAAFGGLSTLGAIAPTVSGAAQESETSTAAPPTVKLEDDPATPHIKVTVERRGQIVLIGINRPYIQNRIDPETYEKLAGLQSRMKRVRCRPPSPVLWQRRRSEQPASHKRRVDGLSPSAATISCVRVAASRHVAVSL
jgi:hypothetical protein